MSVLSDEYIEKCIVSGQKEHNQKILLVEYDEQWPVLFEKEKKESHTF